MNNQSYQEIDLAKITPHPDNPRTNFAGPEFEEFVTSIREQGVLVPVMLRPKGKGFQLVAGERRFRALSRVASENGGIKGRKTPSIVRELTDDYAFDILMIENLHCSRCDQHLRFPENVGGVVMWFVHTVAISFVLTSNWVVRSNIHY